MKKTALIVEDNKALAETFQLILETMLDLKTLVIHDGLQASQYLTTAVPDILLLDLHLPHVNGQEILTQLAEDPQHSTTKVIVATADVFLGTDFQQNYPKAFEIMYKPVSVSKLIDTIKTALA